MVKMQDKPDAQLLREYAESGNEAAFREIVARHTDLVHSAALRQVNLAELAQDLSQSVFVDLARKAKEVGERLPANASLVGWLYRSTRFAVLNHLRDNRRRVMHERQAMEQLITDCGPGQEWERICPLLDDAMEALEETDRAAILLRYFENKSLREVGQSLGTSDGAAQKRVSRAVERLREFFSKRGVTVGASGLVLVVSANAVQAAPVTLAATISNAAVLAGTTFHTSTAIATTKVIALTTLQKTLVAATIVVLAGAGVYETRQSSQLRAQNQTLQQERSPLPGEARQLQQRNTELSTQLAALRDENEQLKTNASELLKLRAEVARLRADLQAAAESRPGPGTKQTDIIAKTWVEKTDALKDYLRQNPKEAIPEIQFMKDRDWLSSIDPSAWYWELTSDKDYHDAMEILRDQAAMRFENLTRDALLKFSDATKQSFPTDFTQLQPYLNPAAAEILAQEYELAPANDVPASALPNDGKLGADEVIKRKAPINENRGRMTIFAVKTGRSINYFMTTY